MDFKDSVIQFASRVEKLCPQIQTEEASKNALIMPLIQLLGYNNSSRRMLNKLYPNSRPKDSNRFKYTAYGK